MKRVYLIISLIIAIFLAIFLLFRKDIGIFEGDDISVDRLMRNLTWQTDLSKNVPYKKGDLLEYSFIIKSLNIAEISLNIDRIKKNMDITDIYLDDKKISENDLKKIKVNSASIVKIDGKAKNTSIQDEVGNIDIINVNVIKKDSPIVQKIVDKTKTPKNISLVNSSFNSNISNLIELSGDNLSNIDFVNIGGKSFKGVLDNGRIYVPVDKGTFGNGDYFIFLQLKNGDIMTMNYKISFKYSDSSINISNITPSAIKNDTDKYITIQGNGFNKIISIQLSNNLILKSAQYTIVNDNVAGIKIPKDLPVGTYNLNIMDTRSIYEIKNMTFNITN